MASTKITRTLGTPTDNKKWTWSTWIKRCNPGTDEYVFELNEDSSHYNSINFNSDRIEFNDNNGGYLGRKITTRKFRDCGAWYHIVCVYDSDNVTADDRMMIYVNGVRETAFDTDTDPTSGAVSFNASGNTCSIGVHNTSSNYMNSDVSHMQFVDGAALAPTAFGSVDATSGIWKIKTTCYATPGNNGFCMKFEDRTNLDLDSSSNAHTFTTTGTLTATYDNPSNNFPTGNPLYKPIGGAFSNGNNTNVGAGNWFTMASTMGVNAGKWYAEFKPSTGSVAMVGVCGDYRINEQAAADAGFGSNTGNPSIGFFYGGQVYVNTSGPGSAFSGTYTTGDIISLALDMDNRNVYVAKDGEWATGSGAWGSTTFDAGVGAQTLDVGNYASADNWLMGCGGNSTTLQANWGNGYFGTTAVSSTNADGAGIGSFEFPVPTGFYALCTKNIKAYGG